MNVYFTKWITSGGKVLWRGEKNLPFVIDRYIKSGNNDLVSYMIKRT